MAIDKREVLRNLDWNEEFPGLDLAKALRTAANFFFVDCTRSQKRDGLRAFNKMKHGLLLVPKAQIYSSVGVDAPAALFKTEDGKPEAADNPISRYAVPMTDEPWTPDCAQSISFRPICA